MSTRERDPGLDTLLDLHGLTLFVDGVCGKGVNLMKTLKIGIADYGQMKDRTMAIARGD